MEQNPEISIREALLTYTQAKIRMAEKFRDGVDVADFAEFEKKLTEIDRVLKRCAKDISKDITSI